MIANRCWWSKPLLFTAALAATAALAGCDGGEDDPPGGEPPDPPDPRDQCLTSTGEGVVAQSAPPGTQRGEPYRWLARTWKSPLGLTIRTYGIAVDGIPVHATRQVEVYDQRGQLVHRAGSGDAVLAALRAPSVASDGPRRFHHPLNASAITRSAQPHPLMRDEQRPVWYYRDGALRPAIAVEQLNLVGEKPVGEIAIRDALGGAELSKRRTIFDVADPEYLVYAREDGRPLYSPLGDIYPYPGGAPDGRIPALVNQRAIRQSSVTHARPEAWIALTSDETHGANVVSFFNSLIGRDGKLADLYTEDGKETPEYGPMPDNIGNDFFAKASLGSFSFAYDATRLATSVEYFERGAPGEPMTPPSKTTVALNAKIVQGFYATNWLHDFFYTAGFDEAAGNAQQTNYGRGGLACDPLIVHAGFLGTFTYPPADGTSPILELGLNGYSLSMRDASMDFSITAHEWGHYMIARLAGGTATEDGMGNLQGQSLHEGIADFVGVLVNIDAGDDLNGAFPIGSYNNLDYRETRNPLPPAEAPADIYYGIRRFPYSMDLAKNPLTFKNLAEPPTQKYYNWKRRGPVLAELHTAGEIFSQALFQCFGNIVAANATTPFEELRARMAKYLVAGLVAFPNHPTFLEARDAILTVIGLASATDRAACRAGFATRGMGSGARGPDREFDVANPSSDPYDAADIQESFVDAD